MYRDFKVLHLLKLDRLPEARGLGFPATKPGWLCCQTDLFHTLNLTVFMSEVKSNVVGRHNACNKKKSDNACLYCLEKYMFPVLFLSEEMHISFILYYPQITLVSWLLLGGIMNRAGQKMFVFYGTFKVNTQMPQKLVMLLLELSSECLRPHLHVTYIMQLPSNLLCN